ncbi:hypothetical protein [Erwinia psidii]|uniref:hypothetical protein n=1 Tax=Erwinia psidii TaxID=69224 RepID=UPI001F429A54
MLYKASPFTAQDIFAGRVTSRWLMPWSANNVATLTAGSDENERLNEHIPLAFARQHAVQAKSAIKVQSGQQKRL